jgi:hypothetical protein
LKKLMTVLLAAVAFALVGISTPAATVKDDAFIFSGNSVVSALDHRQTLRLGERLTLAQLKQRLHSYKVIKSTDCEGNCIKVVGNNGEYLEINDDPGKPISGISGGVGSRDVLGHVVGMSLSKAIGSDTASCDLGMDTNCASKSIKGLFYAIDDARCDEKDKITSESANGRYRIAECMTVGGMVISAFPR